MMKFVCLLAIVGAASAAKFDFRRGDIDGKTATGDTNGCYCGTGAALAGNTDFCNVKQNPVGVVTDKLTCPDGTGTVAATAACKCGKNAAAVAIGEHCFVKDNKDGVMSAAAVPACTTAQSDGKTAAPTGGCYCGKSGALTAATRFCSTALDATGAGVVSAGTVPFCTGTQTTGDAAAPTGNCLCGSQVGGAVTTTATKYCFVQANFVGKAETTAAIKACAAPPTKAPTKAPTKTPTKAAAGGGATGNKTTVAAASTDGVNAGLAFTALCLAVTALRQ